MARIVNLGREKKRRAKATRRAEADANAVRHGLPGHERRRQQAEEEKSRREHEGRRLDDD